MDVGIEIEVDRTVLTEELISVVPVMESTSRFSDSWCEASVYHSAHQTDSWVM